MGWLQRWRMRRAGKQYAQRLGPHLQRAYGASEFYSPPQIRASVAKLGLDATFVVFGYAAFLPEDAFVSLSPQMPPHIPRSDAIELLARLKPHRSSSAPNYYESGIGMVGGTDHFGHGGST